MNRNQIEAPQLLAQAACARLAEVVAAAAARVPAPRLRQRHRGRRPAAQARQLAMYLAHIVFGLSFTRVGVCFGRDRTTVRHACGLIEDRRDDPVQDMALSALETGLIALSATLSGEVVR